MTDDIVVEATYPHPPADVWRVLTTRETLSAWLMETDFEAPVVGRRFFFRDRPRPGWNGVTECEIVEVVPERRLAFAFGIDQEGPTRVEWDLEPTADGGTRLRFRHSGFAGFRGWLMRAGMKHGWTAMHRHAVPFVVAEMRAGRVPTREATTAFRKRGARADARA